MFSVSSLPKAVIIYDNCTNKARNPRRGVYKDPKKGKANCKYDSVDNDRFL